MNRTRCPWCGKIIDRSKDKILWRDVVERRATPRMLHQANCSHCGHKYGQIPVMRYVLAIVFLVLLIVILGFVFQSAVLLVASVIPCFLLLFMPYSKLDDEGKPCDDNPDLHCKITMIEKYGEIKRYELYFLNNCFDEFEPFTLASPIYVYYASKKSNTVLGEFLYMNEKNYDYMENGVCDLYDSEMKPVAKIKIAPETDN